MDLDLLRKLYLKENLTQKEIADRLNSTVNKIGYLLRTNGIRKDEHFRALTSAKNRDYSEIKRKREETNLRKYGVKNVFESKEWQTLAHNNQRKKNEGKLAFNTKKQKETLLKKYGVDNISKLKSTKIKREKTNLEKYGIPYPILSEESQRKAFENNGVTISKTNKKWQKFLKKETGLDFQLEKGHFDLVYKNLAIDINPTVTHNSTFSYAYTTGRIKENKPLSRNYHYKRYLKAKKQGYFLISVFDWYEPNKIIDLIKSKLNLCSNVVYARNCEIKKVNKKEEKEFLEAYHLQNYIPSKVCLGLYYNNELVQLASFGKPRFRKNYDWELLRTCSKYDFVIKGGFSKLLSSFKKENSGRIISYENLNISQIDGEYCPPAGYWVKKDKVISANSVLIKGASRMIGDNNFEKYPKGMENNEIMIKEGFVKVYDCGSNLVEL